MSASPFEVLSQLARQSRQSARGLPQKIEAVPRWRGLGFMSLGQRFVAPMGQITELMDVPGHTRLPGVQPWVIGLSNVRGRLLPLFDLASLMGGQISQQKKAHRVLVLETDELFSGLVVDRSLGMQHFELSQYSEQPAEQAAEHYQPYLVGGYTDSAGDVWHVFDFTRLAEDSRFANASLV
jgi:twitching motility protein PilI